MKRTNNAEFNRICREERRAGNTVVTKLIVSGKPTQLNELWAWVVVDPEGNEDLLIGKNRLPMIGYLREHIEKFADEASVLAADRGWTLKAECFKRAY